MLSQKQLDTFLLVFQVFENNPDNIEMKVDEAMNFIDISPDMFHIKLYRDPKYLYQTNDTLERMANYEMGKNYYKKLHGKKLSAEIE